MHPAQAAPSRPGSPARSGFALTGPSRPLDPRVFAVRPDLADARLADRVFAPHYALPVRRTLAFPAPLVDGTAPVAALEPGEAFDVLDVTGGRAWGIAVAHGLVGYVDAAALEAAT
ncbi:SH3 domain-containing protein [Sphingomonas corticis]|jgi:hypothetical protein|uniref:SH3 domain-containing protein n=1 Tax=Sphingomonas corticis TaxID=2722791 RepID=UPI001EF0CB37|nr:SH3 domain-containing protein [Sphingomonas corticis]